MVLRKVMPKFDNTKYIGTRVKIASAEVINTEFGLALKITSAPIPLQAGDSLP